MLVVLVLVLVLVRMAPFAGALSTSTLAAAAGRFVVVPLVAWATTNAFGGVGTTPLLVERPPRRHLLFS